jgi:DNA-binding phage protein
MDSKNKALHKVKYSLDIYMDNKLRCLPREDRMGNNHSSAWNMTKINAIMRAGDISKSGLAKKIGISRQLIGYYFSSSPTIPKVLKIAKALSTSRRPVKWKDLII